MKSSRHKFELGHIDTAHAPYKRILGRAGSSISIPCQPFAQRYRGMQARRQGGFHVAWKPPPPTNRASIDYLWCKCTRLKHAPPTQWANSDPATQGPEWQQKDRKSLSIFLRKWTLPLLDIWHWKILCEKTLHCIILSLAIDIFDLLLELHIKVNEKTLALILPLLPLWKPPKTFSAYATGMGEICMQMYGNTAWYT